MGHCLRRLFGSWQRCFGDSQVSKRYSDDPHWENLLLFHEYFHGETGEGLGTSHLTDWTALVVRLVRERREKLLQSEFTSVEE